MRSRFAAAFVAGLLCLCWLRAPRPPLYAGVSVSARAYDHEGRFLRLLPAEDGCLRLWTPLADFSPLLVAATKAEAGRDGADPEARIARALARRAAGEAGPDGESAWRRLRVWLFARRLRALYRPDELLEAYLNLASYGPGVDGAGAASLVYFGKNPDQLNLSEAMALSVVPDHPIRATLAPAGNSEDRRQRQRARRRLKQRLADNGKPAAGGL
jgi:penicillin-binding protein 1C